MKTRFQKYKEQSADLAWLSRLYIKGNITIGERDKMKTLSIAIDHYRQTREYRLIMRLIGYWNTFRYSRPVMYFYHKFVQ